MALAVSGSMLKSSFAAKRSTRSMRTGSSRKRTAGSPITQMLRALQVLQAVYVIEYFELAGVVVQGIHRQVAPHRILFQCAVDIVAQ